MCTTVLHDTRSDCLSISFLIKLKKYIPLIENAYSDRGGIEGQREALKTKTGITIRKRMVNDIKKGAVLPPIVIGTANNLIDFKDIDENLDMEKYLENIERRELSIIDGMQRTTALKTAIEEKPELGDSLIRVDLWLAKSVNKLIYRMLVLNTGQVPWDMKRQLLTVYSSVAREVNENVSNIELLGLTQNGRRTKAGQFQGNLIVEGFLVFSSGKTNLDLKDQVSQDFARMDVTQSISEDSFLTNFLKVLEKLVDLDIALSNIGVNEAENDWKVKLGKDIFTSNPAVIGFVGAASTFIYGEPGFRINQGIEGKLDNFVSSVDAFLEKLAKNPSDNILGLMTLNEMLSAKSNKVGEYERNLYSKAFLSLFKHGDNVNSLEQCWMSV